MENGGELPTNGFRNKFKQFFSSGKNKKTLSAEYTNEPGDMHSYEGMSIGPSYFKEVLDPFLENLTTESIILDVGAGTGEISAHADDQGFNIINVDLYKSGLQTAKKNKGDSLAIQASGGELPFGDNSVDAIHSKDTIVHIENQKAFLSELFRVLKPGGRLLLVFSVALTKKPSYFFTAPERTINLASDAGLELLERGEWKPTANEASSDWYSIKKTVQNPRFVLKMKKPAY